MFDINKNDGIENKSKIILNVFFETLTFIFTLYFMSCFLISFQRELVKVLISVVNISIIINFKNSIEEELGKKGTYILLLMSLIIVILFVYSFGYFEISTNLIKY